MTIDQLNALSDYEINCAVAIMLRPVLSEGSDRIIKTATDGVHLYLPNSSGVCMSIGSFDYCYDAREYMEIAIEHGISCITSKGLDSLWAKCEEENEVSPVYPLHGDFMGRAVCTVFLLMNGESK